jgi:hypothetical protein
VTSPRKRDACRTLAAGHSISVRLQQSPNSSPVSALFEPALSTDWELVQSEGAMFVDLDDVVHH